MKADAQASAQEIARLRDQVVSPSWNRYTAYVYERTAKQKDSNRQRSYNFDCFAEATGVDPDLIYNMRDLEGDFWELLSALCGRTYFPDEFPQDILGVGARAAALPGLGPAQEYFEDSGVPRQRIVHRANAPLLERLVEELTAMVVVEGQKLKRDRDPERLIGGKSFAKSLKKARTRLSRARGAEQASVVQIDWCRVAPDGCRAEVRDIKAGGNHGEAKAKENIHKLIRAALVVAADEVELGFAVAYSNRKSGEIQSALRRFTTERGLLIARDWLRQTLPAPLVSEFTSLYREAGLEAWRLCQQPSLRSAA